MQVGEGRAQGCQEFVVDAMEDELVTITEKRWKTFEVPFLDVQAQRV
jgi:hypothetical protein